MSPQLVEEATRLLEHFGAETRIFNPSGLPLPDDMPVEHPKVQELRDLVQWSEGQVWCSPERHGAMSAVFKAQIDWIPLALGAVHPTQGKTLAVMSGGRMVTVRPNQLPDPCIKGNGVHLFKWTPFLAPASGIAMHQRNAYPKPFKSQIVQEGLQSFSAAIPAPAC